MHAVSNETSMSEWTCQAEPSADSPPEVCGAPSSSELISSLMTTTPVLVCCHETLRVESILISVSGWSSDGFDLSQALESRQDLDLDVPAPRVSCVESSSN